MGRQDTTNLRKERNHDESGFYGEHPDLLALDLRFLDVMPDRCKKA